MAKNADTEASLGGVGAEWPRLVSTNVGQARSAQPSPWLNTALWAKHGSPFVPWTLPVLLFAAWWALTSAGLVPAEILVPPKAVWAAAQELLTSGELRAHLQSSLARLAFGFSIGTLCGLAFGVALGASRTVSGLCGPVFHIARQVPTFALIPPFIIIFGIEETLKVVLVTKATFFPIAIAASEGVRNIPRPFREVAQVLRLPWVTRLRRLVLPATLPTMAAGIRVSLGRSWMVLVAAELMAAESGLGQMMEMGRQMFRMDVVLVGVFLTGSLGLLFDKSLRRLEARLTPWKQA